MIKDSFRLSLKNLKHRGIRSWLTLLGIFIGVLAVVALISLGDGLKLAVTSQFGISSTEVLTVQAGGVSGFGPPGSGAVDKLTVQDVEAIERLSSVKRTFRRNLPSGKLEYNDRVIFGFTINIPKGEKRKFAYEILNIKAEKGRLLNDGDVGKVFLGHNFYANKVGLEKIIEPGDKVLIQDKKFEVVGVLEKKGSFIFDNIVYMNEKELEELMGYGDEVDIIAVQAKSSEDIPKAKEEIEKLLRKRRNVKEGEEDFEVSTPEAALESVNSILSGVTAFIAIIASISIFIGAIGIVNTMTTSVLERKKEIGIMKAIGAKNSHIFTQFFIESSLLGLIGGLIGSFFGTLIGLLGTAGINNFIGAEISPTINFGLIALTLFGSFLIGGVAGIIPAMNASKQNPVEVLRG